MKKQKKDELVTTESCDDVLSSLGEKYGEIYSKIHDEIIRENLTGIKSDYLEDLRDDGFFDDAPCPCCE